MLFNQLYYTKMKKIRILISIILLIIVIVVLFKYCIKYQENKIAKLEEKIEQIKSETVPLKFIILERDSNTIRFVIKFIDVAGNTISKDTLKLEGSELSLDFYSVPLNDDYYIAFPYKVFTDVIAPDDGILLYDYYNVNGFPQIYANDEYDDDVREGLQQLFELILAGHETEIEGQFGNMVHDLKHIQQFRTNEVYKVVSRTKGGIEVMTDL